MARTADVVDVHSEGGARQVLAAIAEHDPDRARVRMAVHLIGVEDFLHTAQPADL